MLTLSYLLPIRSATPPTPELTAYLRTIRNYCSLIIVDGSEPNVFAAAHEAWSGLGAHVAPDPTLRCANGKVRGVLTGLELVDTGGVVIADDDVRYTVAGLDDIAYALDRADVVLPQNYFDPLPWHARWDTGRMLINRVTGGDFPGTMGVRLELTHRAGGYDGDVLFENLELMRTVQAVGGRCIRLPSVYVRRLPPSTEHFVSQRVRQAYDEFARPARFAAWLAVAPLLLARRRATTLLTLTASSIALAECGRRRCGGRTYFPWSCSLLAPAWVLERAVCIWLSLVMRASGGVPYSGGRIRRAATSSATLRRRHSASFDAGIAGFTVHLADKGFLSKSYG